LPCSDELFQGISSLFERCARIGPVDLIEINMVDS